MVLTFYLLIQPVGSITGYYNCSLISVDFLFSVLLQPRKIKIPEHINRKAFRISSIRELSWDNKTASRMMTPMKHAKALKPTPMIAIILISVL